MKSRALIALLLFSLAASAQTKQAAFAKIETLLKKSKGIKVGEMTITDYQFNESQIRMNVTDPKGPGVMAYSKIAWEGFDYYITEMEEDENVSRVEFSVEEEMQTTSYQNNKEVDKVMEDEFIILLKTTDASKLEQLLDELQTYTYKSLSQIRTMSNSALFAYIKTELGKVLEDDGAVVKTVNECELTVVNSSDVEIAMPTAGLSIHSKELVSEEHLFCYGTDRAMVKMIKDGATTRKNVEHPDVMLYLEEDNVVELNYALKRLATLCQ